MAACFNYVLKAVVHFLVRESVKHTSRHGDIDPAKETRKGSQKLSGSVCKQILKSLSAVGMKSGEKILVKGDCQNCLKKLWLLLIVLFFLLTTFVYLCVFN